MTFSVRLRQLREEKNLTQTELGKIFNLSKQTISSYENGGSTPGQETLKRLADFFGVSTDYLLGHSSIREFDIVDIFQNDDIKITASGKPLTQEQRLNILRVLTGPVTPAKPHIPLLGELKSGDPLLTDQNIIGQVEIPADLEGKVDFALYVRDDSLIGAGINDKDIVLCKQQETASGGQIVAAFINETETTLRYFIREDGKSALKSANPNYKDIELQPGVQLLGYAVKILKDPPPISAYREYSSLKEEHLQEWNNVIEKALSFGIKPSAVGEFVGTQVEIAKKLKGK